MTDITFNPPPYVADLTKESLQSTPDCMVRVVRFTRRDTREYTAKRPSVLINKGSGGIRHKIGNDKVTNCTVVDIVSDILSCTVNKSKGAPGTFTLMLAPGNVNYHHLLHPGDHVFIWMKRKGLGREAKRGTDGLIDSTIANLDVNSGLKLYGVITGVRRSYRVSQDGHKSLRYQITGKDFGYFLEQQVYFNGTLASQIKDAAFLNATMGGALATTLQSPKTLVEQFLSLMLGSGTKEMQQGTDSPNYKIWGRMASENKIIYLPDKVREMFNSANVPGETLGEIMRPQVGVERYLQDAMALVPELRPMWGIRMFRMTPGSQMSIWSVLQSYSNPTMNEMFIDLKSNGRILRPCFVMRQIPFTSSRVADILETAEGVPCTKFISLPRIKVPETFILSEDIGRGDHERFNLIELCGSFPGKEDLINNAALLTLGNYAIDEGSAKRFGLRTMIPRTDYSFPTPDDSRKFDASKGKEVVSTVPKWINVLADWWLGAHTYESGTIEMMGIEEPISLGDNLEITRQLPGDEAGVNELYHIEAYTHVYHVDASGAKSFRTSVQVTRGQRVDEFPIYSSGQVAAEDTLPIGWSSPDQDSTKEVDTRATPSGLDSEEKPTDRKKSEVS